MGAHGACSLRVQQRHRHPRAEAACRVGKNPHWFLKYYFLFATPDNSALYCFPLPSCLRASSERVAYFAGVRWSRKSMALSFPLSPDLGSTHREVLHSHLLKILFTDHWTFLACRLLTGNWLNSQIFRMFFRYFVWNFQFISHGFVAEVCFRAQNRVCLEEQECALWSVCLYTRLSHGDVWIIYKLIDPLIFDRAIWCFYV